MLEQVYSPADGRFLPDRYILGTCPHCGSAAARGDQCEACTRTLDPVDLVQPRSALSGSTDLEIRESRHLFLRQSALAGELEDWIATCKNWPPLVTSIARKWLDEGLKDRCITRDLAWGVKVPKEGYEGKVFYVWFDAPIAYLAATWEWADADPGRRDWRSWWWDADDVDYRQFLGKDNVPFHAVSFPCTLIGSREPWKRVDVIKGVNWLVYDGGKFSTSARRGVFLDQALALLPADYWRWWLAANAPEGNDTDFTFARFARDVNHDLADNFGNLVNRVLKLVVTRCGSVLPARGEPGELRKPFSPPSSTGISAALRRHHDGCALRKAAEEVERHLAPRQRLSRGASALGALRPRSRSGRRRAQRRRQSRGALREDRLALHPAQRGPRARGARGGFGLAALAAIRRRRRSARSRAEGGSRTSRYCSASSRPIGWQSASSNSPGRPNRLGAHALADAESARHECKRKQRGRDREGRAHAGDEIAGHERAEERDPDRARGLAHGVQYAGRHAGLRLLDARRAARWSSAARRGRSRSG